MGQTYSEPANALKLSFTDTTKHFSQTLSKPDHAKGMIIYMESTIGASASLSLVMRVLNPLTGNPIYTAPASTTDQTLISGLTTGTTNIVGYMYPGLTAGYAFRLSAPVPDTFQLYVVDSDGNSANTVRVDYQYLY